jgi:aminoglycoside phosphotransferase (APT) family kinase protein
MTSDEVLPGIAVDAVTAWLVDNIEGAKAPFSFSLITGGRSNLTFRVEGADGAVFVLRRPPLGAILATAHDMAREHRIISAVAHSTVPVPEALGLCTDESVNDAPFYVMNYVPGVVLAEPDDVVANLADPTARRQLSSNVVEVLARLHQVDPDTIGLGELGRKEDYLGRQLKRWRNQWEKSKTRDVPEVEETYELLLQAKPEQRYTGVVHGDYRLGNLLVDPSGSESGPTVNAVLDWELCTLGDVLADVGYLLNTWSGPDEPATTGGTVPPTVAGGFADRQELVEAYGERTGFDIAGLDYYRAFQYWRFCGIIQGVLARYELGVMGDQADTEGYANQVVEHAQQALQLVRSLG